jgi:hypothetical protein
MSKKIDLLEYEEMIKNSRITKWHKKYGIPEKEFNLFNKALGELLDSNEFKAMLDKHVEKFFFGRKNNARN